MCTVLDFAVMSSILRGSNPESVNVPSMSNDTVLILSFQQQVDTAVDLYCRKITQHAVTFDDRLYKLLRRDSSIIETVVCKVRDILGSEGPEGLEIWLETMRHELLFSPK